MFRGKCAKCSEEAELERCHECLQLFCESCISTHECFGIKSKAKQLNVTGLLSTEIRSLNGISQKLNGNWPMWLLFLFQILQFALLVNVREQVLELRVRAEINRVR